MRALKLDRSEPTITQRDSHSFDRYLRDVAKIEMLEPKDEVECANKIRQGDQQALEKLVKANLRFVISVAKQYQGNNVPLSDLVSAGNMGLIRAAYKFDHTKGFKFISYAVWWIRQSITTAVVKHSNSIRIPANCEDAQHEYNKVFNKLEQELGRAPGYNELEENLSHNANRSRYLIESQTSRPESLDASLASDDDESFTHLNVLEDKAVESPENYTDITYQKQCLEHALQQLEQAEKDILIKRFGLENRETSTYEEIGMELDLTGERVRQISNLALKKLRRRPELRTMLETQIDFVD